MSTTNDLSWMSDAEEGGFGVATPDMDKLLDQVPITDISATETFWFNFSIPEENIDGHVYIWVHSNLRTTTVGVWVAKGANSHPLGCEHFNARHYLPYPKVTADTISCPEIGVTLKTLKPLTEYQVTYRDPNSDAALDLHFAATMTPILRGNSAHLDQPGHVTGQLSVNGKRYAIDCYALRDHSWGQPRPETPYPLPPIGWGAAIFDQGRTALLFNGCDDPKHSPEWAGVYDAAKAPTLVDGWIHRDGERHKLVRMSKKSVKNVANQMQTTALECALEDDSGCQFKLTGTLVAGTPWSAWTSIFTHWLLMRWELDGRMVGYGSYLDTCWGDYVRRFIAKQDM